MESDRELVELAAKAAGIVVVYNPTKGKYFTTNKRERRFIPFDPLKSDGDALRLVVKLNIHITSDSTEAWASTFLVTAIEPMGGDKYAATRRAIVRAAAEMAA